MEFSFFCIFWHVVGIDQEFLRTQFQFLNVLPQDVALVVGKSIDGRQQEKTYLQRGIGAITPPAARAPR